MPQQKTSLMIFNLPMATRIGKAGNREVSLSHSHVRRVRSFGAGEKQFVVPGKVERADVARKRTDCLHRSAITLEANDSRSDLARPALAHNIGAALASAAKYGVDPSIQSLTKAAQPCRLPLGAKSGGNDLALICAAVLVRVPQQDELRTLGHENIVARENEATNSIEPRAKDIGPRSIENENTIGIGKTAGFEGVFAAHSDPHSAPGIPIDGDRIPI